PGAVDEPQQREADPPGDAPCDEDPGHERGEPPPDLLLLRLEQLQHHGRVERTVGIVVGGTHYYFVSQTALPDPPVCQFDHAGREPDALRSGNKLDGSCPPSPRSPTRRSCPSAPCGTN